MKIHCVQHKMGFDHVALDRWRGEVACLVKSCTLFVVKINSWHGGNVGGHCCQLVIDLCTCTSRHNLSSHHLSLIAVAHIWYF